MNMALDSSYPFIPTAAIEQSLKDQPTFVPKTTMQYPIL
jgi:hypothetical protein